ncbi:hypothetical protein RRG08_056484 [Elysia crispata]|uniref:Uncharacterized protein n=1 Tax=Elysia crispata TaxID=231223 RepID=A0AAE1CL83_9GAST|nr:hypothetical protein RRG08_056484 [Elysia crispata]
MRCHPIRARLKVEISWHQMARLVTKEDRSYIFCGHSFPRGHHDFCIRTGGKHRKEGKRRAVCVCVGGGRKEESCMCMCGRGKERGELYVYVWEGEGKRRAVCVCVGGGRKEESCMCMCGRGKERGELYVYVWEGEGKRRGVCVYVGGGREEERWSADTGIDLTCLTSRVQRTARQPEKFMISPTVSSRAHDGSCCSEWRALEPELDNEDYRETVSRPANNRRAVLVLFLPRPTARPIVSGRSETGEQTRDIASGILSSPFVS